ncbi:MAG: hypothetical protein LBQ30_03895 [Treponema sp.]|jgi:hypothetical protein|nr:hypothetical protein [Treponema sp.]
MKQATYRVCFPRFLAALLMGGLSACGIDDYLVLYPVLGVPDVELNTKASITLALQEESNYFTHFTLYYRIYISAVPLSGRITQGDHSTLNATLDSDYRVFLPYTASDTTISTSVGSLFGNRSYQTLTLEGPAIDEVLSRNSIGMTLTLDFMEGIIPVLRLNGAEYRLQRSNGGGLFNPVPTNRYFLNTLELNTNANATSGVNADVAPLSTAAEVRYTYVSFYIVGTGLDPNFSPIYSAPTFIAVLRLPESF